MAIPNTMPACESAPKVDPVRNGCKYLTLLANSQRGWGHHRRRSDPTRSPFHLAKSRLYGTDDRGQLSVLIHIEGSWGDKWEFPQSRRMANQTRGSRRALPALWVAGRSHQRWDLSSCQTGTDAERPAHRDRGDDRSCGRLIIWSCRPHVHLALSGPPT